MSKKQLFCFSLVLSFFVGIFFVSFARAAEKVTIRADYMMSGYIAPFVLAADKGFYQKRGLDVEVLEGRGSQTTLQTVASGADAFGVADIATAAQAISQGVPVAVVGAIHQKTPAGFIWRAETDIKRPQDLIGKTAAFTAGTTGHKLWPAFLEANNIRGDQIKVNFTSGEAKNTLLVQKKIDFTIGYSTGDYLRIKLLDPNVVFKSYADWGVTVIGTGLAARNDMIKGKPSLVRAYVEGSIEGWQYSIAHSEEAVRITLKYFPKVAPDLIRDGLKASIDLLTTENTKNKPLFWMSEADWNNMLDLFKKYLGMERKEAKVYYTNEFIPEK